jgi:hypothetical protein
MRGGAYYGRLRRRRSYKVSPRRSTKRLSRYVARQFIAIGAALVLIVATGFVSNRSDVLDWAGSGPSVASNVTGRASVIDGDTFEIHGQRIRVWGIDAPGARSRSRGSGDGRSVDRYCSNPALGSKTHQRAAVLTGGTPPVRLLLINGLMSSNIIELGS